MRLAIRTLKPADLSAAADFVRQQPLEHERYGSLLKRLPALWAPLLLSGSLTAVGVGDLDEGRGPFLGLIVRVFLRDEFVEECKQAVFCLGPELARRVHENRSPILSPKEIGVANARDGVNIATWVCHVDYSSPDADAGNLVTREFVEAVTLQFRGFQIKEMFGVTLDVPNARVALSAGAYVWDAGAHRYDRYSDVSDDGLRSLVERPHLVGISRELAFAECGSWVSLLFAWSPPKTGFSPGEQRLMLAAVHGRTDEELAIELAISPSTVKNTWRSIYDKAGRRLPHVLSNNARLTEVDSSSDIRRGKEKRARLLAYVRDHPEELRPFSRTRSAPMASPTR